MGGSIAVLVVLQTLLVVFACIASDSNSSNSNSG